MKKHPSRIAGFFHTLHMDMRKTLYNVGFPAGLLAIVLLNLANTVYTDTTNDKSYSVIEALLTERNGLVLQEYSFNRLDVSFGILSGYAAMFLPVIAAIPFVIGFMGERNSGCMRMNIFRTGTWNYCFSKFVACFLSGGLVVLLGTMLYAAVTFGLFPTLDSYQLPQEMLNHLSYYQNAVGYALKMFGVNFLFGAVMAMPAFFLSAFCRNMFLITCVPFLLKYLYDAAFNIFVVNLTIRNTPSSACSSPTAFPRLAFRTSARKFF